MAMLNNQRVTLQLLGIWVIPLVALTNHGGPFFVNDSLRADWRPWGKPQVIGLPPFLTHWIFHEINHPACYWVPPFMAPPMYIDIYIYIYLKCHHPNWLILFRGVETTNQIYNKWINGFLNSFNAFLLILFGFSFIFAVDIRPNRSTAQVVRRLGTCQSPTARAQLGSVASQQPTSCWKKENRPRALHLQAGFHTFQDLWQLTVARPTTFSSAEKGLPEVRSRNQKPRRWVSREEPTAEKWQLHCQLQGSLVQKLRHLAAGSV